MPFSSRLLLPALSIFALHCATEIEPTASGESALTLASRVKDVRTVRGAGDGSSPEWFASAGASVVFGTGYDGAIYSTNTTTGATLRIVAPWIRIAEGPVEHGGFAYFTATRETAATYLYRSDGTSAGTVALGEVSANASHSLTSTAFGLAFCDGGALKLVAADGTITTLSPASGDYTRVVALGDALVAQGASKILRWSPTRGAVVTSTYPFGAAATVLRAGTTSLYTLEATGSAAPIVSRADAAGALAGSAHLRTAPRATESYALDMVTLADVAVVLAVADSGALELWTTDGTEAGTRRLRTSGRRGEHPFLRVIDGKVYGGDESAIFETDGVSLRELTARGPAKGALVKLGGDLFYVTRAATGSSDVLARLALSDASMTDVVGAARTAAPSVARGRLYFAGGDGEPWVSDGTAAGSALVADVNDVGEQSSKPEYFAELGGKVVFLADDGVHGREPWVTDGTEAGTRMLRDVAPGAASSARSVRVNGAWACVYGEQGTTCTDGTDAGTARITDGYARQIVAAGGALYFAGSREGHYVLGRWNGAGAPTILVGDAFLGGMVALADGRVLGVSDGASAAIYVTDGSAAGTTRVTTSVPLPTGSLMTVRAMGNRALMSFLDRTTNLTELWALDGSSLEKLFDGHVQWWTTPKSIGATTVLSVSTGTATADNRLVATDGTRAGTHVLLDGFVGFDSVVAGDLVYFWNGARVVATDGTTAGTQTFDLPADTHAAQLVAATGGFFYLDPGASSTWPAPLYFFDSATRASRRCADRADGLLAAPGGVVFRGSSGATGDALMFSKGSLLTTRALTSPTTLAPRDYVTIGHSVFFAATDAAGDREPWMASLGVIGTGFGSH